MLRHCFGQRIFVCWLPPPEDKSSNNIIAATVLTSLAGEASLDDCPNGGILLDHSIDSDGDGKLYVEFEFATEP